MALQKVVFVAMRRGDRYAHLSPEFTHAQRSPIDEMYQDGGKHRRLAALIDSGPAKIRKASFAPEANQFVSEVVQNGTALPDFVSTMQFKKQHRLGF
jgi:hypothetical protein